MEGFDIFNVPEDGFLLAADFRRCVRTVCMLQVMKGEEVDIFYKLGFASYQVLDQLSGGMINLVMLSVVVLIVPQREKMWFTHNNFLLYSPSDTSSVFVSGGSAVSAEIWTKTR